MDTTEATTDPRETLVPVYCKNGHAINLWGNPMVAEAGVLVQWWGNPFVCGKCGAPCMGRKH